jgi:hypothetical protein
MMASGVLAIGGRAASDEDLQHASSSWHILNKLVRTLSAGGGGEARERSGGTS